MRERGVGDRADRESGVVAAELALILPILLMLLLGMVQLGIAYSRSQALQGAAREAARVGSIPGTSEAVICGRADAAIGAILPAHVCSPVFVGGGDCATADNVVVTLTAETELAIPFLPSPPTLGLVAVGDYRCE